MVESTSYKSTIKPHIPIIWIAFLIIWVILCINIDDTISDLMSITSICIAFYLVVRSAFLLDSLHISENGITIVDHYIWGWSRKNTYQWSDIKDLSFTQEQGSKGNKRLLLVIQTENLRKEHCISHLCFNPAEAGLVIKKYSLISNFEVKDFIDRYKVYR